MVLAPARPPTLNRLRALRDQQYLSQQELAELADVARNTIQRIETGQLRPRGKTVRKLAKALKVKPADLSGPA